MNHKTIILTLLLLVSISAKAQIETQDSEPKIGLVLSGGGAKGFAHIGVLKVIDSLGIKIDYIAGTSMGAIVGSLYASGYSGEQLDSIFKVTNFEDLISDYIPRAAKTFYERESDEKYMMVLPFDDFKIKLPSALSRGQNVYGMLSKLTMHVSDIEDFSKLPIPFFCIATNIETGKAVMLNKGNLAKLVMASGAFPSLFQPVNIDDNLLIDGGVVNNYPLYELKAKGVDLIIGVDVQDDLATREELKSAPQILLQINNYRTIRDMAVKSKKTDVYIKPNIADFNVVSFNDMDEIVDIGYDAAQKNIDGLVKVRALQRHDKIEQLEIKPVDSIQINTFSIKGNYNYTRAYVLGKLKLKQNEKVSYDEFNQGINNLVATHNFDSFLYSLEPSIYNDGYNMHAELKESASTTFLKLGLHYDDLYKSSALINLTKKRILTKNDVMSFDFIVGDNIRYNFEYYIDNGFYWSVGLRSRYDEFSQNISAATILTPSQLTSINVNKLNLQVTDFTNQFYLQTLFRKDFSLTLGAEHKRFKLTTETILTNTNNQEKTVFDNSNYYSLFGGLKFDTYDDKYFPKSGFLFDSDFHWYLNSSDFNNNFQNFSIAQATIGYSQKLSKNLSANLTADGGFTIEEGSPYFNFVLGGYGARLIHNLKPFLGYDFISLTGDSYVKTTLNLDYEIFKKNHINFIANVANVGDNIFENGEWITVPDFTGYALGYSLETIMGPVEVKYSWSPESSKGFWFFNLGFQF